MKYSFLIRSCIYLISLYALLNGWWFIVLPLMIIGAWQFSFRLEIIFAGLIYDGLFGMSPGMGLWGYAGTIVAVGIIIIQLILKKVVR